MTRVLQVDDDADILEITRLSLVELGGFELLQFRSGIEALASYRAFNPDLILLDVMMPELSGEETFQRLSEGIDPTKTPIVFMTAKGNQNSRTRLMALGAREIILKPFDPMLLADQVGQLIAA